MVLKDIDPNDESGLQRFSYHEILNYQYFIGTSMTISILTCRLFNIVVDAHYQYLYTRPTLVITT